MWLLALALFASWGSASAVEGGGVIRPSQNCTRDCLNQGRPECEFCHITNNLTNFSQELGINVGNFFGGCVPKPCEYLMQDKGLCQHRVNKPRNVNFRFTDPTTSTVVIQWKPSEDNIYFLRGFQVLLQELPLRTLPIQCQLLMFHSRLQLKPKDKERVYESRPFSNLHPGQQYVASVLALPIPEEWDDLSSEIKFRTNALPLANWYPRNVTVHQQHCNLVVTFDLAPHSLNIKGYNIYYKKKGEVMKYQSIDVDPDKNDTQFTYVITNLTTGVNYTIQVAGNYLDPVRKTLYFFMKPVESAVTESGVKPIILVVSITGTILLLLVTFIIWKKRRRKWRCYNRGADKHQEIKTNLDVMDHLHKPPQENAHSVPTVFLCYSDLDGPKHTNVVLHFATYLQDHCRCQVALDLWEHLKIAEEGYMGWLCRQIEESDYIIVICSKAMKQFVECKHDDPQEARGFEHGGMFAVAISLIAEKVRQAMVCSGNISKFIAAFFEYSGERDVPDLLALATKYCLMEEFPKLFSHLHNVELNRPGFYLHVENISKDNYHQVPSGFGLYTAIHTIN
ncbi:interleukin-17 receptor D [Latimeria chalumnae]|uniref:interleukin-17 receptor D n=1 Tax=Latimeria chalumnae TaxID=7897 RepID=UPI00313D02BD